MAVEKENGRNSRRTQGEEYAAAPLGEMPPMPAAPDVERALLGALLLEPEHLAAVSPAIMPSAFADETNKRIYDEMLSMSEQGEKIDLVTVTTTRPALSDLVPYIVSLTQCVGSAVSVMEHACILQSFDVRRRLITHGYELAARAARDADAGSTLAWATERTDEIMTQAAHTSDMRPIGEIAAECLDSLEAGAKARAAGRPVGLGSGLRALDEVTHGWRGSQLIVLAGRPAMGKSAIAASFARAAAQSVPVCVFTLEMSGKQTLDRMIIAESGVSAGKYRACNVDAGDWRRIETAVETLSAQPIYINDRAGISVQELAAQCKQMHRKGKCGLVIIDYLQLLTTKNADRFTREREVANISRAAKMLAKDINAPVILLSQLSRKIEERADKTPLLSDLRESGAIEQDADVVIFIDRPEVYGQSEMDAGGYTLESTSAGLLHIVKNRDGAVGRIAFRHDGAMGNITDYFRPEQPRGAVAEDDLPY